MSTHACPVIKVELLPHPNADALSLVKIGGWQVVVRTDDWKDQPLGVFIPPDYIVPNDAKFSFLGDDRRIKVRRLRGQYSQGLLLPAPDGAVVGTDMMVEWDITRYESPCDTAGDAVPGPSLFHAPVYDVESYQNFPDAINPGEEVVATEKIHGANARYTFQGGVMYCGSRRQWKAEDKTSAWWRALTDEMRAFLEANPGWVLYGEVYGPVQSLKYGKNAATFAAFDIFTQHNWAGYDRCRLLAERAGIEWVPEIRRGPFNAEVFKELAEGPSTVPGADHIREGIVVKAVRERPVLCIPYGRAMVKFVSNAYLEKAA